jgi:hypothetical protein
VVRGADVGAARDDQECAEPTLVTPSIGEGFDRGAAGVDTVEENDCVLLLGELPREAFFEQGHIRVDVRRAAERRENSAEKPLQLPGGGSLDDDDPSACAHVVRAERACECRLPKPS